jgi:uncharacterized membrane protein (DUF373 family)
MPLICSAVRADGETSVSDYHIGVSEKESPSSSPPHDQEPSGEPVNGFASILGTILDHSDAIIYGIIGISFLVGALFALGYSFWDVGTIMIGRSESEPSSVSFVALAIIKFISDLLLVLIIMEILRTIIHYLKEHTTSLHPFLFIGIVSATRGILSVGARLAIEKLDAPDFNRAMIELGVNAFVVLVLGITLKLLGKLVKES